MITVWNLNKISIRIQIKSTGEIDTASQPQTLQQQRNLDWVQQGCNQGNIIKEISHKQETCFRSNLHFLGIK